GTEIAAKDGIQDQSRSKVRIFTSREMSCNAHRALHPGFIVLNACNMISCGFYRVAGGSNRMRLAPGFFSEQFFYQMYILLSNTSCHKNAAVSGVIMFAVKATQQFRV